MLETERLLLRPWTSDDLPVLRSFSTDPVLMHHFGRAALVDDSVERLARMQRFDRELGVSFRAVVRKADGAVIGNCGLKPLTIPWPHPDDIEIGWLLRQDCWGRGYAVEAAAPMLAIGLARWPRVVAITACSNMPSQRVMQRLGMTHLPALDFDHPDVADDHFARPHVTFAKEAPCTKPTA
jgi:RimJ/RimL family protein N-acetyltransferase